MINRRPAFQFSLQRITRTCTHAENTQVHTHRCTHTGAHTQARATIRCAVHGTKSQLLRKREKRAFYSGKKDTQRLGKEESLHLYRGEAVSTWHLCPSQLCRHSTSAHKQGAWRHRVLATSVRTGQQHFPGSTSPKCKWITLKVKHTRRYVLSNNRNVF